MLKKTVLLGLLLLPLFFLLHNYNELFGFIPFKQLASFGLLVYGILLLLYLILHPTSLPFPKKIFILFIIAVFNLFFDPLYRFFQAITFKSLPASFWIFPLVWLSVLIVLILKIVRINNLSPKLTMFINTAIIILIATELVTTVDYSMAMKKNHNLIYPSKQICENYTPVNRPDSSKPDIYFLVFDEYTNNQTLKKVWNFDNDDIIRWLTANGFYSPANTRANYSFTVYSVSSTFNMNYLDARKGADGTVTRNLMQANQSLSDNEIFCILEKENYGINFIAPFQNSINKNASTEWFKYLVDHQLDMQTLPGKIVAHLKWYFISDKWKGPKENEVPSAVKEKYREIRNTIDQIKATADSSTNRKPHFVYGHLMVTHDPHIFDSTGGLFTTKDYGSSLFNSYPAQVMEANKVIKEIVTHIQSHNKRNTIIIIEGDHGFRQFFTGDGWVDRTPDSLKKYFFPNFNTIYFPEKNYSRIYDSVSPVNMFRIILNQYFNQNLPLLKDSMILVKDN